MPSLTAEFAEYLVESVVANASSEKEAPDSSCPCRASVTPEDVTSETVAAMPTQLESAREMTSDQENTPSSTPDTNAARLPEPSWISCALKFVGLKRRTQKEEKVHRATQVDVSNGKSRYSPYLVRPGMLDTPKSDRNPLGEIQSPHSQPLKTMADHVPRQRELKKLGGFIPTRHEFKRLNGFVPKQRQMRRLQKDFDIPKEN